MCKSQCPQCVSIKQNSESCPDDSLKWANW